ncbi:MAG: fasciclin domain-containing protein [Candidatus Bathyarchaeota archaeon]|nr:fasciclin domain-containing protein [Candidatus Bathyarchaeota archaeon]
MDIVETAMASSEFKTLVEAVKAAGLVETLKGQGPFTVFAPTDEAFSKIPKGDLDALLKDTAQLKNVLTFHVAEGKMMASDLEKHTYLQALNGGELRIDAKRWHLHRNIKVNDANIIKADLVVDNGVCHAIDKVLMPKVAMVGEQTM